jgi:ribonuclease J
MPVHGTLHHLRRHAELAKRLGVETCAVVENGTPLVCDGRTLVTEPPVRHGRISIAKGGEPLTDEALRGRAELGRSGIVVVALSIDAGSSAPSSARAVVRGVPGVGAGDGAHVRLEREALRAAASFREGRGLALEEFVRRAVRRVVEDLSGTRPVVEIAITREPG